jgi:DNA-binding CsgD family transcriptional regulator
MKTQLPAGLVDSNVEIFESNNKLMATYKGRVIDFHSLPDNIMNQFLDLLIEDETARNEFRKNNIMDLGKMLTEYVRCRFGGFDNQPDYANGKFIAEYWACGRRGDCPYNEKICPKLKAKNGELSRREIEIIQLFANGLSIKEVAEKLSIAFDTARTHSQNIHKKLGFNKSTEVVRFAFKHNLTA